MYFKEFHGGFGKPQVFLRNGQVAYCDCSFALKPCHACLWRTAPLNFEGFHVMAALVKTSVMARWSVEAWPLALSQLHERAHTCHIVLLLVLVWWRILCQKSLGHMQVWEWILLWINIAYQPEAVVLRISCKKRCQIDSISPAFQDMQELLRMRVLSIPSPPLHFAMWCLSPSGGKSQTGMQEREIHIYIYICCEVIIWAKFGHFRCYYLGQAGVIIWAKLFLAYKNSGFKRFFAHTVII